MWNPNDVKPRPRRNRWAPKPTHPQPLPELESEAWRQVRAAINAKIDICKPFSQVDEKLRLFSQLSACWIQSHPDDMADRQDTKARLTALAAVCEHAPQYAKTLGAMRVIAQDADCVTFEVPSISNPGTFYRPVLHKASGAVVCHCAGATRGKCWHKQSGRDLYALMQPMAALMQIDNITDAAFDALDTLDDVPELIGYASEAAKPQRVPQLSADAMARAQAPATVDYFALFNED